MLKSTTITTVQDGQPRQWVLAVGRSYRVSANARIKHHRGRICTVTDFNALLPTRVQVIFEQGQRSALRVEDLAEEVVLVERQLAG